MVNWTFDSVFYHVYPLGFCDAPRTNDFHSAPIPRLEKLYEWIGHMRELGINALYLGPVFESETHGYDTKDYFSVDRRLGTNETLKYIITELHKNGIRVALDAVFHHVGRAFWAFSDLREKGSSSQYKDWFSNVDFNRRSKYNDRFSYDGWNGHESLVKLNLSNEHVKQHLFEAVKMWIETLDIDGLRLDAADYISIEFLHELSRFCKSTAGDFLLLGEVIHGDYRKWVNNDTLDSVTNYEGYKSLYSSHNDANYFEIAYSLNRQYGETGMYCGLCLYNFADNHDVTRIASILERKVHLYPLTCLLFTMPGMPSIYYGSEFGVPGAKGKYDDHDLRPGLSLAQLYANPPEPGLLPVIKKLSRIRRDHKALRHGNYVQLFVGSNQFVFAREFEDQIIIIGVNSDTAKARIECKLPPKYDNLQFKDVLNDGDTVAIKKGELSHFVWPNWGFVLVGSISD